MQSGRGQTIRMDLRPSCPTGISMARKLAIALAIALVLALAVYAAPVHAAKQYIQKVEMVDLADAVRITVTSDAPLSMHERRVGKLIVFDLYGVLNASQQKRTNFNSGGINYVRCAQYKDSPAIARIVVSVTGSHEYLVESENGNRRTVIQVLKAGAIRQADDAPKAVEAEPEAIISSKPILVASTAPQVAAAQKAQVVAVAPKQISLDFVASDIHDVVKALAVQSGVNVVASPEVKGEVTVSLNKVTPEEALKLVANLSGYKFAMVDGTYVVGTQDNLKNLAAGGASTSDDRTTDAVLIKYADPAMITQMLEKEYGAVQVTSAGGGSKDSEAGGASVLILSGRASDVGAAKAMVESIEESLASRTVSAKMEIYEVKYADISQLPAMLMSAIRGLKVSIGPNQGFMMESPSAIAMGTSGSDSSKGTGTSKTAPVPPKILMLNGTQQEIDQAKDLLAQLDVPQAQIAIEAKMVDVSDEASKGLGIQWGENGVLSAPVFSEVRDVTDQALRIGRFARSALSITSMIRAVVESGEAKVLASPNVSALDGKPASIFIGDEVKYVIRVDRTIEGTTVSTETARVGVQLHTISRISSDGYITMDLHPEVSVIKRWIDTPAGLSLPEISRRFVSSTIRVKDGETIVIGGLMKEEERETLSGVPLLKDLPLLGAFFRSKSSEKVHSEIMMFITPRIISTM